MGKTLDAFQTRAVTIEGNAVVSAGAGSGKTTVLAERYLRLVREKGAKVEEILTLTFTRKAAAEMNSRIYAGLKASAAADPHVRLQAERFDRARISTLDAFCSQVLKLSSSRFGLPPTFTLDDEKAGDLARRLTFSFILENAEDPSMGFLIEANGFTRVLDGFGGLATRYLHLGETRDFPELHRRQFGFLAEEIERLAARYAELRREILALDPGPGITETQAANLEKARGILKSAGPELPAEPGRLLGIAGDLKTFPLPGKTANLELLRYRDLANALRDLAAEIKPLAGTLESKDLLAGLFDLLGRFQEAVQRERLVSGIISFQDCAELAVRALAEDESLRAYYKGLFRYIMIDEFQDNNRLQKNLLYLLAEKRDRSAPGIPLPEDLEAGKLFFVGDEKQSIYRFRGADVAVFKGLSEELEGGGAFVDLEVNYRSEPGLIDFFNHLFSRLLGGAEKNFEARFVPLKAREPRLRAKPQIAVYRHPYVKDDEAEEGEEKLGADEAEAFFLASKIKAWVEGRSLAVPAEAGDRPADYGDVAVLMRSTSNQTVYERMFRLLDVPYETRSTRSLFLEAPANDLYAFLQCLVYPEDGEAYAALLRSPFVNVSDEALVAILLEERLAFRLQEEAAERLDEADRGRYLAAAELYREAEDLARHASVPELLSFLWFEGGYRFSVLRNPAKHAYLELYDYLREYALMAEGESLASFLDRLRPNLGKYERIPELGIQRGKSSGVRILTVHEAKGLEFPVVILANAGNQGRNDSGGSELFHVSREHGLSVGLGERGGKYNYFYVLGKKDEEEEAAAELKRLLYVACTRAEAHLVVSGCFNRNNREGEKSFLGLVFAALGLSPDDEAGEPVFPCGLGLIPDVTREEIEAHFRGRKERLPEEVLSRYQGEPLERKAERTRWTVTELAALAEAAAEARAEKLPGLAVDDLLSGKEADTFFGTLCHRLIENSLKGRKEKDPLRGQCPAPEHYGRLLEEAERLSLRFFASAFAGEILKAGSVETEVGFVSVFSGRAVRGSIDLAVVGKDRVTVIDFKTDRLKAEASHDLQLAYYRKAAEDLYGLPVETYLFYLRSAEALLRNPPPPANGLPGGD